jgi:hypothetical protein
MVRIRWTWSTTERAIVVVDSPVRSGHPGMIRMTTSRVGVVGIRKKTSLVDAGETAMTTIVAVGEGEIRMRRILRAIGTGILTVVVVAMNVMIDLIVVVVEIAMTIVMTSVAVVIEILAHPVAIAIETVMTIVGIVVEIVIVTVVLVIEIVMMIVSVKFAIVVALVVRAVAVVTMTVMTTSHAAVVGARTRMMT